MSVEAFLFYCRKVGLQMEDLEAIDIGMALNFIDEYVEFNKPENEKTRKATQEDFDNF